MKILFAGSECTPYASSGGLGTVMEYLPGALHARGLEVIRVAPLYRQVRESGAPIKFTGMVVSEPMGGGGNFCNGEVWCLETQPHTFFIENAGYYCRGDLYGDQYGPYADNFNRYIFFQKAVVALIDMLGLRPDIVHAHDWQTGFLPLFLQHGTAGQGREKSEKTVFTIHNLTFQGQVDSASFNITNLPADLHTPLHVEHFGSVNSLKAGIGSADLVTTLSVDYAKQIRSPGPGCGLDAVLRGLGDKLVGVPNGLDYLVWDPEQDAWLAANFSKTKPDAKEDCKAAVCAKLRIEADSATPLCLFAATPKELVDFELIEEVLLHMLTCQAACMFLGQGFQQKASTFDKWRREFLGKLYVNFDPVDDDLLHQMLAGADVMLLANRHEPGITSQLEALRYGTVPVVFATGALDDTVIDVLEAPTRGTGLKFHEFSAHAFMEAADHALRLFADKAEWRKLQKRCMRQDLSWANTAERYVELYEQLL